MHDLEARLVHIIRMTPWFMRVLRAVRDLRVPDAGVGGGVVRTLVWDHLHGYPQPTPLRLARAGNRCGGGLAGQ